MYDDLVESLIAIKNKWQEELDTLHYLIQVHPEVELECMIKIEAIEEFLEDIEEISEERDFG